MLVNTVATATEGAWNVADVGNGSTLGYTYGTRSFSQNGLGVLGIQNSQVSSGILLTKQAGVYGYSQANAVGVVGHCATNAGMWGYSASSIGVIGNSASFVGVQGVGLGGTGVGGWFVGARAALTLGTAAAPGAPTSGAHLIGDIYLDSAAVVWVCIGTGTPGSWVRLTGVANGGTGGATTYLPTPVRLLDARSGASSELVNRPALAGNEVYTLSVAGLGGIPGGAQGLICDVTVLGPGGNGNLSLFPAGHTAPVTASMTFLAGAFLANGVNTALGAGGQVAIQNQSGASTPLVLDAVAYVS